MRCLGMLLVTIVAGTLLSVLPAVAGSDQKITLMLGGKFCDMYLGDVEDALKKVPGVKSVDLKSMKGHAIVVADGEKVKTRQLTDAVKGVKGEAWHCTAEVMK